MKLARFAADGRVLDGYLEGEKLVVPEGGIYEADEVVWLPPVSLAAKAIGLALNYSDHAEELDLDLPEAPVLFNKNPSTFIGHKGRIVAPQNIDYMHYEIELVAVISARARHVKAADADDYILGYTIGNDVTIRDFVTNYYRPPVKAKGFDTFGPIGPVIATKDEIDDPDDLHLRTYVNGELRQEGHTGYLIHNVPAIIEYVTEFMTLNPGDMLWTGTPKGISHIYPGDHIRMEIDGIGVLENTVVEAD
jgi:5-oxopent-3-ene-1,2,5-tricarboxylate decarboxylase/2-hydroxyhepta-2,4-diene-1,7-dioate isomerase